MNIKAIYGDVNRIHILWMFKRRCVYTVESSHCCNGSVAAAVYYKFPMSSVIVILIPAPPIIVPVELLLLPLAWAGSRSYINLLLTKKSEVIVCDRCHKEN